MIIFITFGNANNNRFEFMIFAKYFVNYYFWNFIQLKEIFNNYLGFTYFLRADLFNYLFYISLNLLKINLQFLNFSF